MTGVPFSVTYSAPRHIAIIMDGNRRWAKQFGLPVALGHANGARRLRSIVQACADRGIRYLTVFAFSTENWQRPTAEVSALISLLALYLKNEVKDMNSKGVCFKMIGDTSGFSARIQSLISDAQTKTVHNDTITLTIAANYGGRQDVIQAVKAWQVAYPEKTLESIDEAGLSAHLSMAYAPDPDLLIRTGGESRLSNFLLWQISYCEFFFTDVLWPSFNTEILDQAINWYKARDRRFGGSTSLTAVSA